MVNKGPRFAYTHCRYFKRREDIVSSNAINLAYARPAEQWVQALPVGNGRLGGMIFGQAATERIQLNEDSLWYGGAKRRDNPEAALHLADIRRLLFEGRIEEAERLARLTMTSVPKYFAPYQTLGELELVFEDIEPDIRDYSRVLDLNSGVATITFKSGETHTAGKCSSVRWTG